ncbi:MAG: lipopolysaccharide assembly protein LapB [Betaproteobacteria bacterium]|nr:lipopolysaccharide assembly protein LapB [Betaproteobacteria bacterium]
MLFEYWWLLALPLFFGLGWLAARIDIKELLSESRSLPESYFKGLNFLLNQKPDEAVEALIEVVKSEAPEAIELHFTLGGLFRRRGEVERAIRMHQHLLDRPGLPREQQHAAVFELGQDYQKAGLLDRAEALFQDLRGTDFAEEASKRLLGIYVQEKDWAKAIDTASQLGVLSSASYHMEIAQFHCELAQQEQAQGHAEAACAHAEEALRVNRGCVRATILYGDLELGRDPSAAIARWKQVEIQDPEYLHLVGGKLLEAYRAAGRTVEGLDLLRGYLSRYPSIDLLNTVFQGVLEQEGPDPAYELVRDELRRNPTLQGLDRLLEAAQLRGDVGADRRQDMQLVKHLIHQHTRRLAVYRCESCGFDARQFYWHCPACGGWETFPARRREEKEAVQAVAPR